MGLEAIKRQIVIFIDTVPFLSVFLSCKEISSKSQVPKGKALQSFATSKLLNIDITRAVS